MFGYLIAAGLGFFAAKYMHHGKKKTEQNAQAQGGLSLNVTPQGATLNTQKPADNAAQTK